jgi:tRNA nucleotidyltransferase (CCA-adding enzyme)
VRRAVAASRWEHFDHKADIGVRGIGATREAAFEQLAMAMTGVVTDPVGVRPSVPVELRCEATDDEALAVDWLNAIVYEMATRHMLFGRFDVSIESGGLRAVAWGEPVDRRRHRPAVEVKGATYTALHVGRQPDGTWLAQCIVDV